MSDKNDTKNVKLTTIKESVNPGVKKAQGSVTPEKKSVNPEKLTSPAAPPPPSKKPSRE